MEKKSKFSSPFRDQGLCKIIGNDGSEMSKIRLRVINSNLPVQRLNMFKSQREKKTKLYD